jgi:hypothetical protein
MLLFVIYHLWSIIGDSGFVVSLILPSTVALLFLTGRPESWDRALTEDASHGRTETIEAEKAQDCPLATHRHDE